MKFQLNNLNTSQLHKLSDICSDIAQVCLGSIVIPFVLDRFKPFVVVWGLVLAIIFWTSSILLKKGKQK